METFEDLLARLDETDASGWEDEYARVPVEMNRDQAGDVVMSDRVYAEWFLFRFDAGPPGVALPTFEDAYEAVLARGDGSPLDAYRIIFESNPVLDYKEASGRLDLLRNSAGCALRGGTTWFAMWLAARAGVAAIAFDEPELAWAFLDGLAVDGIRHPHMRQLEIFEPLRKSEKALRSPWVKTVIGWMWSNLGVPVMPVLPMSRPSEDGASLHEIREELTRIGATKVLALLDAYLQEDDRSLVHEHEAHPLVRELRTRMMSDDLTVPAVDDLPDWFGDWARALLRSGEFVLARLAGLVLYQQGERQLAAVLALPAAHASDLEVLTGAMDEPAWQTLCAELLAAREVLTEEAANALVALALPHHIYRNDAVIGLATNMHFLEGLQFDPKGVVAQVVATLQAVNEEMMSTRATIQPQVDAMLRDVRRQAGQLESRGLQLTRHDIVRGAENVSVPDVSTALLDLASEAVAARSPLERLLMATALMNAVDATEHGERWKGMLAPMAADALYELDERELFPWRLRLLNDAIKGAESLESRADLLFKRANTRRAICREKLDELELVLQDLKSSMSDARRAGWASLYAAATAQWVKVSVRVALTRGELSDECVEQCDAAIKDALEFAQEPLDRAILHQARAHLLRAMRSPDAVKAFEEALSLLSPDVRLWVEVAAELVAELGRVGRVDDALQCGRDFLQQTPANAPPIEQGMLNLTLGEAFMKAQQGDEARRHLETGLSLVRGRDIFTEMLARMSLARLGLATDDSSLWEEHLRVLRDHRDELDDMTRRDLDQVEAVVAEKHGSSDEHRAKLVEALAAANLPHEIAGLRLELARLDLAAGSDVEDLDGVLTAAINADVDAYYSDILVDVLCNYGVAWSEATRQVVMRWARDKRRSNEHERKHHHRGAQIEQSVSQVSTSEVESIVGMLFHPAGRAFMEVRKRLVSTSEFDTAAFGILEQFGPSMKNAMQADMEEHSLIGKPNEVEALLASLNPAHDDEARPGILAARVLALAYLARNGRCEVSEVREATDAAMASLGDVDERFVRATLLRALAEIWSPNDHVDDPVCDFAYAADLLQRCVELEGGESEATTDTLGLLARARRYSPAGDQNENLRETRRLYELLLDRGENANWPDVHANIRRNLAEVKSQLGMGSRLGRYYASEAELKEALSKAQSSRQKAELRAQLAWEQTQIGTMLGGADGRRYLESALAHFDQVDRTAVDASVLKNIMLNRQVCRAGLASFDGGRAGYVASWRAFLTTLDEAEAPYVFATAKYNLADGLLSGGEMTPEEFEEGIRLAREAAEVRTLEKNPRHYWESAYRIGRSLLHALGAARFDLLPMAPESVFDVARDWLLKALEAARKLGPGEELVQTALSLCELATGEPRPADLVKHAEDAWSYVQQSSANLLLNADNREREAGTATVTALMLANRLAQEMSLIAPQSELAFVLQGERAKSVERWMVRGQLPAMRLLRARLTRPEGVSAAAWDELQRALKERNEGVMVDALETLRETAQDFLIEDHANEVTWQWLQARPGSIAVSLILGYPTPLALVMQVDERGERKRWVLGLRISPPPIPLDTLPDVVRKSGVEGRDTNETLDTLAAWLGEGVVGPIVRFVGEKPSAVLWSPGPGLRTISPRALWGEIPVAMTTSLVLPDLTNAPRRPRSTLVAMADPGEGQLSLKGMGTEVVASLADIAGSRGPVRVMGSQGNRFGRELFGETHAVRESAASSSDVLSEVAGHEVVVFLGHGDVPTLEEAALVCVNAQGQIDPLDVATLAQSPDALAGATVVLLSCDSGRVGDRLAEPGGLAGTLLSAGARCVIAPLWPVRLDVAETVGAAILEGLAAGEEPWSVLANLENEGPSDTPWLGPGSLASEQIVEKSFQRRSFVAWVG
ncbi:CHAT domain-containing protein [Lujinxingia vulgaris]|uniref:CHAT domain-containing protein n=1 Tax=Lujinxingia vulgaris TaxID=2600176 RepID=A0A5C6X7U2_9DELT|nr:CHAT domain-containing protein [Lujinxingia vulgaris]TXD37914.1 CHAT domain-containing protein [Lujinxingia vulgaris]